MEQYLRAYVNYQQDDWTDLLYSAEFAYNNATHSSTQMSPFYANYGFNPQFNLSVNNDVQNSESGLDFVEHLKGVHEFLKSEIKKALLNQAKYFNRKVLAPPPLTAGDDVWLLRKNIKTTRPSSTLDYKKLGPFKIKKKINNVAYRLDLPASMKIHPVFHVSLLEKVLKNNIPNRNLAEAMPVIIDGEEYYEVNKILDVRKLKGKTQYFVDWIGLGISERTWENARNLPKEIIAEFHAKRPNVATSSPASVRP